MVMVITRPPGRDPAGLRSGHQAPSRVDQDPLTFHEANGKPKPRKCTEWTLEDAIN